MGPAVLGHDVAKHARGPGQPVHLDEGDVGGAGDRDPGRVVGRVDLESGLDAGRGSGKSGEWARCASSAIPRRAAPPPCEESLLPIIARAGPPALRMPRSCAADAGGAGRRAGIRIRRRGSTAPAEPHASARSTPPAPSRTVEW